MSELRGKIVTANIKTLNSTALSMQSRQKDLEDQDG